MLTGLNRFRTVILPDFFIDRIVRISSYNDFLKAVEIKRESGGGSVHAIEQLELRGGNASNVAYNLGRLGVGVDLITMADRSSEGFLRGAFSDLQNVSIDVVNGRPGYTVALEFPYRRRLVNVMLSDVGEVANFGPDRVPDNGWTKIREADLVGVFNWAANHQGSKLAERVFTEASERGATTYFAPADLSSRPDEIPPLLDALQHHLSILSINENEARTIAKTLSIDPLPSGYIPEHVAKSAETLSAAIATTVDLHTPIGSATSSDGETHYSPSFEAERLICTGAGDVWDAANIAGHLLHLEPPERLRLANAAAALYISSRDAESPSPEQIRSLLEKEG